MHRRTPSSGSRPSTPQSSCPAELKVIAASGLLHSEVIDRTASGPVSSTELTGQPLVRPSQPQHIDFVPAKYNRITV